MVQAPALLRRAIFRERALPASPSRSVNRSLAANKRAGSRSWRRAGSSRAARSIRRRSDRSARARGEGIGRPLQPIQTGPVQGRWTISPHGGIPGRRRNSMPPPRMAATPPRPPPPNRSARWAVSIARDLGIPKSRPTASAVARAPAALMPNLARREGRASGPPRALRDARPATARPPPGRSGAGDPSRPRPGAGGGRTGSSGPRPGRRRREPPRPLAIPALADPASRLPGGRGR
jgi:hypothetical protein